MSLEFVRLFLHKLLVEFVETNGDCGIGLGPVQLLPFLSYIKSIALCLCLTPKNVVNVLSTFKILS